MTRPGSSQEEEEFRKALHRASVRSTFGEWIPIFGAGAAAFAMLVVMIALFAGHRVPTAIILGIPFAAGAGTLVLLRKLFD